MRLFEKQTEFSILLAQLILKAQGMGYLIHIGEVFRPPEMAEIYAKEGKGIKNSLHTLKLAVDILLFSYDADYLTSIESYRALGEWWKTNSNAEFSCAWGGDFKIMDANHFSISHEGFS